MWIPDGVVSKCPILQGMDRLLKCKRGSWKVIKKRLNKLHECILIVFIENSMHKNVFIYADIEKQWKKRGEVMNK